MGKPFDSTLKQLVDRYGRDWLPFLCGRLGLPPDTPAEPLDADLATVSPQADKLFRLGAPAGGLLHLELQASRAPDLPDQMHLYNALAKRRYGGPVRSLLLLLRREADAADLTGELKEEHERGQYLWFAYDVVRLWQMPAAPFLAGPLGLLPLGVLTDDAQPALQAVLGRVDARLEREGVPADVHEEVLLACNILLGLRHDRATIDQMFTGFRTMRESTTYQGILDEGREEGRQEGQRAGRREGQREGRQKECRGSILDLAGLRLGAPPAAVTARLNAIANLERLRRMLRRATAAADWDDLLNTP